MTVPLLGKSETPVEPRSAVAAHEAPPVEAWLVITPNDVVISTLKEIISGLSGDFDRLDGEPDRDDLIRSLRSVIAATQDLAQFTLNVHRDIACGNLNYPPNVFD